MIAKDDDRIESEKNGDQTKKKQESINNQWEEKCEIEMRGGKKRDENPIL